MLHLQVRPRAREVGRNALPLQVQPHAHEVGCYAITLSYQSQILSSLRNYPPLEGSPDPYNQAYP